MLGQFGPFFAAVLVTSVSQGREGMRGFFGRFLRWRAHVAWVAVSLFLLPGTMLAAIYAYAYFHGSVASLYLRGEWWTLLWHFAYMIVLGGPLGEEPGWRGFALPRLQDAYGPVMGSLWLGVLHSVWHLPLWWMYPPPCPFWMFVAGGILVTFLFTWLFNHTQGSVLYSLLFHTSMSVASVRLPEVPAYHVWVLVLSAVVASVFLSDPRLGYGVRSANEYEIGE